MRGLVHVSAFHQLHLNKFCILTTWSVSSVCMHHDNAFYTAVCIPACKNGGTCTSPGVCSCTSDWSGSRCTDRKLMQLKSMISMAGNLL